MATRRGDELPPPIKDPDPGKHGPGQLLPDEWNFPGPWPDAEPDYVPKPGQKGYSTKDQIAMKHGSDTCIGGCGKRR